MPYDFVAIDFETANSYYDSACSVGIAAVRDGKVVDQFYSLIKPVGQFDQKNTSIHGIMESDVEEAPTASELLDSVLPYFSTHWPIVAHNASFDIAVLRNSFHIEEDGLWYTDTMNLCRPFVEGSLSLVNCAKHFGIYVHNHHNALDDAINCALIAQTVVDVCNCETLIEFLAKVPDIKRSWMEDLKYSSKMADHRSQNNRRTYPLSPKPSEIIPTGCVDPNHPLCGKILVFTGELSISRGDAMQLAVNAGAIVKTSVSRKVDYLIVGKQDLSLVGDDGLSTKEEKAYDLNKQGKSIIVFLNEAEFLRLAQNQTVEV